MVNYSFMSRIEPFIIYVILYFPVFFSAESNENIFSNNRLILIYTVISLFQITFLIYFMKLKKTDNNKSGIKKVQFNNISTSLLYFTFLLIVLIILNLILESFFEQKNIDIEKSGLFILKAIYISLLTAYREETFFRSYFISSSEYFYGKRFSVLSSSLLFSISHISGGIPSVLSALCAGFFLSYIFLKHRNLHINSLTHAFYNFAILVF